MPIQFDYLFIFFHIAEIEGLEYATNLRNELTSHCYEQYIDYIYALNMTGNEMFLNGFTLVACMADRNIVCHAGHYIHLLVCAYYLIYICLGKRQGLSVQFLSSVQLQDVGTVHYS